MRITAQPNAEFTVERYKICSAMNVKFTNMSSFSNSYAWFIDNVYYADSTDINVTFIESCYDVKEIKLIAYDTLSGFSDTDTKLVEVFDSCFYHLTGTFLKCPGDTILLEANPEAISTQFNTSQPVNIIGGCASCPYIRFIILHSLTTIDRLSTYAGNCSDLTTFEYSCIGNKIELNSSPSFKVYPNPASEYVILEMEVFEPGNISIMDLSGRELIQIQISKNPEKIKLEQFENGLYFIRIQTNKGIIKTKVFEINN